MQLPMHIDAIFEDPGAVICAFTNLCMVPALVFGPAVVAVVLAVLRRSLAPLKHAQVMWRGFLFGWLRWQEQKPAEESTWASFHASQDASYVRRFIPAANAPVRPLVERFDIESYSHFSAK